MKSNVRKACAFVLALCLTALAAPAAAQVYTGRIDVTVSDATGGVLPGVTVSIAGPQNVTVVTDDKGEAHFLNLAPGTYAVTLELFYPAYKGGTAVKGEFKAVSETVTYEVETKEPLKVRVVLPAKK